MLPQPKLIAICDMPYILRLLFIQSPSYNYTATFSIRTLDGPCQISVAGGRIRREGYWLYKERENTPPIRWLHPLPSPFSGAQYWYRSTSQEKLHWSERITGRIPASIAWPTINSQLHPYSSRISRAVMVKRIHTRRIRSPITPILVFYPPCAIIKKNTRCGFKN